MEVAIQRTIAADTANIHHQLVKSSFLQREEYKINRIHEEKKKFIFNSLLTFVKI